MYDDAGDVVATDSKSDKERYGEERPTAEHLIHLGGRLPGQAVVVVKVNSMLTECPG